MKNIIILLCIASSAAFGQSDTTDLKALINANFPNNTSNYITPARLREVAIEQMRSSANLLEESEFEESVLVKDSVKTDVGYFVWNGVYYAPIESMGVQTVKLEIASADVLTLNSVPVAFGLTVPVGYYAQLLSAQMKATYGGTPYATNVILEIGFPSVKSIFADNVLGFNSNAFVNMDLESSGAQVSATDVVVSVNAGNPTAGNSDITIYLTYVLIEI
jgi:hypothetical protein